MISFWPGRGRFNFIHSAFLFLLTILLFTILSYHLSSPRLTITQLLPKTKSICMEYTKKHYLNLLVEIMNMNVQPASMILIFKNLIRTTPCTLRVTPMISGIKIFCTYQQRNEKQMQAHYFIQ